MILSIQNERIWRWTTHHRLEFWWGTTTSIVQKVCSVYHFKTPFYWKITSSIKMLLWNLKKKLSTFPLWMFVTALWYVASKWTSQQLIFKAIIYNLLNNIRLSFWGYASIYPIIHTFIEKTVYLCAFWNVRLSNVKKQKSF